VVDHFLAHAATSTATAARTDFTAAKNAFAGRLARLTAYWEGEGDYYTGRGLSSTGIHLHGGLCAVDPSIIPYGSVVVIPGVGQFLAADTGSAVVSREAAREAGRTLAERSALVIDIFFDRRSDGEAFAAEQQKFVPISWWTPSSTSHAAQAARGVFADEDWNKIYSKQL
jgi:3D (Asp-Asp-Asp) domain-containing protein